MKTNWKKRFDKEFMLLSTTLDLNIDKKGVARFTRKETIWGKELKDFIQSLLQDFAKEMIDSQDGDMRFFDDSGTEWTQINIDRRKLIEVAKRWRVNL